MNFVASCLAVLLFALISAAPLHAAEPVVRVDILTPAPIVAGQQVQVQVDVLVPNFFLSPLQFPIFDLPNAIVTLPDVRALNLVETIDGDELEAYTSGTKPIPDSATLAREAEKADEAAAAVAEDARQAERNRVAGQRIVMPPAPPMPTID